MNIYLIIEDYYESSHVIAAFSKKENAEKHILLNNKSIDWDVVGYKVDEYDYSNTEIVDALYCKTYIYKFKEEILTLGDSIFSSEVLAKTEIPEDRITIYPKSFKKGDLLELGCIEVWAENIKEGKKKIKKKLEELKKQG